MNRALLAILVALAAAYVPAGVCWGDEPKAAPDANATKPLTVGEMIPDVSVQDDSGDSVALRSLVDAGPTVIVFFRGSWCPICTRHFQELIKIHPQVVEQGATMIAISPDSVENSRANAQKLKTPFELYSDSDVAAAKAFGLAFQVDDAVITKYQGFGIDLEKASGRDHHVLPVPAVYIVDASGKILFAHSNPDYSKRLDGKKIVAELKKLQ